MADVDIGLGDALADAVQRINRRDQVPHADLGLALFDCLQVDETGARTILDRETLVSLLPDRFERTCDRDPGSPRRPGEVCELDVLRLRLCYR